MDSNLIYSVGLGTQVNIKRTDGRVHSAVVSGINWEASSVTVEWFERNETKGKEIDLETLVGLNPHIITDKGGRNESVGANVTTNLNMMPNGVNSNNNPNQLLHQSQPTTRGTMGNNMKAPEAPSLIHKLQPKGLKNRSLIPGGSSLTTTNLNGTANTNKNGVTQILPAQRGTLTNVNKGPEAITPSLIQKFQNTGLNRGNVHPSATTTNLAGGRIPRAGMNTRQTQQLPPPPQKIIEPPPPVEVEDMEVSSVGGGTVTRGGDGGTGQASRRRSNVVKEVDKLKKNREERRLRQAEAKIEKENLMNIDPGNPNWEFLNMIREYRQTLEITPLRDSDPVEDHQITVCVRKRPMNKKELMRKEVDVITVPNKNTTSVHEPKTKVDLTRYLENQHFRFDYAFDDNCTNEMVYKYSARPLVQTVFEGGMATCFAYGQTGSGKTHTMGGDFNGKTQDCQKGIYAMTAKDVFRFLSMANYRPLSLGVSCSFFEIYSGKVFDLLANKAKLRVLEDGKQQVQVVGLTERQVNSVEDVLKLIQLGNAARTSGSTSANANSSRSHAVFQVILRTPLQKLHGKFSLIDLAGNERGADTSSADRQTRMEGAEINKSLLALKECIRALGRKGAHLPFRASKLTQVLRDSFIGEKSKTCMIAMISPGLSSCEHSLNTLRYADRVKGLAVLDPMEVKMSAVPEDEDDMENMESESDLAQLRSLNEGEMSGEMLTFHETISKVQEAEDEVVEFHKLIIESNSRWLNTDKQLLNMTNQVDYDQDDRVSMYTQQLEDLCLEKISMLNELRNKVAKYRNYLVEEETISRKITSAAPNARR